MMSKKELSSPKSTQNYTKNKTLLVLGAKSDIAQAVAREFALHNFDVILAARNSSDELLAAMKTDLEIRGGVRAFAVEFDAEDFAAHDEFYKNLPASPDVVLCAFGYLGKQGQAEKDWSEAARIINANYTGAVSILNIAANDFESKSAGCIIGISSVAGERGRASNYIYGSAKGGFSIFLDGLRHRLSRFDVNVITVKPGFVETKMTAGMDLPKILTAQPEQLGKAVFDAYRKKKATLYYLPAWRFIMFVIRNVPEFIFQKTKL